MPSLAALGGAEVAEPPPPLGCPVVQHTNNVYITLHYIIWSSHDRIDLI
jgi:hypothetical protein